MTGLATALTSALAAGLIAAAGLVGGGTTDRPTQRALVIDASVARDGRDLISPDLRTRGAELRLPRTASEAETDLRYLAARGYRLEVAGPVSSAAAETAGVAATVKTP
jgi:hypothetical protein